MQATVERIRPTNSKKEHPIRLLADEDLDFVAQFVRASGSLKEMAQLHHVSYPTIRASLDRVISSLNERLTGVAPDPITELLAELVERGEIKVTTAKQIRSVYREALERASA